MIYSRTILWLLILSLFQARAMDSETLTILKEDPKLVPRSVDSLHKLCLIKVLKRLAADEEGEFLEEVTQETEGKKTNPHYGPLKEALIWDNLVRLYKTEGMSLPEKRHYNEFIGEYKRLCGMITINLGDPCRTEIRGTLNHVFDLAISPDGTRLACASSKIHIWDIDHLPQLENQLVLEEPEDITVVQGMYFEYMVNLRWCADGSKLYANIYSALGEYVCCWEARGGKLLSKQKLSFAIMSRGNRGFYSQALSSDGKYLVGVRDGTRRTFKDHARGKRPPIPRKSVLVDLRDLTVIPKRHLERYIADSDITSRLSVGFSPDSRYMVTTGCEKLFTLTSLPGQEETIFSLEGNVSAFAFSPDSRYLIIAMERYPSVTRSDLHGVILYETDGFIEIHLVDLESSTSKKVYELKVSQIFQKVRHIVFNGRYAAFAFMELCLDCTDCIYLVDCKKDEGVKLFGLPSYSVTSLLLDQQSRYLFIGCDENNLHILPLFALAEKKRLVDLLHCIKQ